LTITTTSLPVGTVQAPYSQTLAANGGTTPYTWAVTAGTLPAGLSLNTSTGVISGTPTTAGTQNFTVTVNRQRQHQDNSDRVTVDQYRTVRSRSAPIRWADGIVQIPYSQQLVAVGGIAPYTWKLATGSLPTGLTIKFQLGSY
jgi:hypothetical protein